MIEIFLILLNIAIRLIRFIFLPVKLVHFIVYGYPAATIVGYSWYSRSNYGKMVAACDDDPEDIVPTYELWLERATESLRIMEAKKWLVIKVNIRTPALLSWLKDNELTNTRENREKYVTFRIEGLREKGI